MYTMNIIIMCINILQKNTSTCNNTLYNNAKKGFNEIYYIVHCRSFMTCCLFVYFSPEKPYGDQALFMKRRTYETVGGFPTYFLMEDYIMVCNETKYDPLHVYVINIYLLIYCFMVHQHPTVI